MVLLQIVFYLRFCRENEKNYGQLPGYPARSIARTIINTDEESRAAKIPSEGLVWGG
jgi:hypothetical protein